MIFPYTEIFPHIYSLIEKMNYLLPQTAESDLILIMK